MNAIQALSQLSYGPRVSPTGLEAAMLIDQYLATRKHALRPSTHYSTQLYLRRWDGSLDRRGIVAWLDVVEAQSGSVTADRARAALSGYCSWLVDRGELDFNPAAGRNRARGRARDRVLSLEELRRVWDVAGPGDYGAIVRLLIRTGCRRGEIGGLRAGEILADRLVIGAARTKQGRTHMVPILPGWAVKPFSFGGWSQSQRRLNARAGLPEPFVLHDLRRSAATHWAELGLADADLVELALGHGRQGVRGVYNRAPRWQDRLVLARNWDAVLTQLGHCPS